ncbi:CBS domain-containing protein [Candidatus Micrarchaeota archaeon]|nr:CBS domain-containing protein [Candidatus Micrarchaeota archaeon]
MIKKIPKMRKNLGLTQKQLADLAGVSQSLIAKIESGKIDPAYSKVVQIFQALEKEQNKEKKMVREVMSLNIISVKPGDTLEKAVKLMRTKDISQLPVLEDGKCIGSISESMVVELVSDGDRNFKSTLVEDVMRSSFPTVPANSLVDAIADLLCYYSAVLIENKGRLVGIVTKADLLKAI